MSIYALIYVLVAAVSANCSDEFYIQDWEGNYLFTYLPSIEGCGVNAWGTHVIAVTSDKSLATTFQKCNIGTYSENKYHLKVFKGKFLGKYKHGLCEDGSYECVNSSGSVVAEEDDKDMITQDKTTSVDDQGHSFFYLRFSGGKYLSYSSYDIECSKYPHKYVQYGSTKRLFKFVSHKPCTVKKSLVSTVTTTNAKFDTPKCETGKTIAENDSCKAICTYGGTDGVYTCKDGELKETTQSNCISKAEETDKIKNELGTAFSELNEQDRKDAIEWIMNNLSTLKAKHGEQLKEAFNDYRVESILKKKKDDSDVAQFGVFGGLVCLLALH